MCPETTQTRIKSANWPDSKKMKERYGSNWVIFLDNETLHLSRFCVSYSVTDYRVCTQSHLWNAALKGKLWTNYTSVHLRFGREESWISPEGVCKEVFVFFTRNNAPISAWKLWIAYLHKRFMTSVYFHLLYLPPCGFSYLHVHFWLLPCGVFWRHFPRACRKCLQNVTRQ